MGLWPLVGAIFMAYLFVKDIPQLNARDARRGSWGHGPRPDTDVLLLGEEESLLQDAREGRPHCCPRGVREKSLAPVDPLVQDGVVRIVSLVPSVTETLTAWDRVPIACTRFCERPDLEHVGGTKNPDIARIEELRPDLVVMDAEENRREDYDALVDRGLAVCVVHIRSLADVNSSMDELALQGRCDVAPDRAGRTGAHSPSSLRPDMATPVDGPRLADLRELTARTRWRRERVRRGWGVPRGRTRRRSCSPPRRRARSERAVSLQRSPAARTGIRRAHVLR